MSKKFEEYIYANVFYNLVLFFQLYYIQKYVQGEGIKSSSDRTGWGLLQMRLAAHRKHCSEHKSDQHISLQLFI